MKGKGIVANTVAILAGVTVPAGLVAALGAGTGAVGTTTGLASLGAGAVATGGLGMAGGLVAVPAIGIACFLGVKKLTKLF